MSAGAAGSAGPSAAETPDPVPDPVTRNIEDILELESRELARATRAQLWLETLSRGLARPAFPVGLLIFIVAWVSLNVTTTAPGIPHFDPPPFPWLTGLLTLMALLITTVVLIGQGRQSTLAEQRAHLDLQISLLTEQKVTKLIHLLEELRADTPGVRMREDPHVSVLKKPADPAQVASALKELDPSSPADGRPADASPDEQ
jgi:uncharacterized membrane protein